MIKQITKVKVRYCETDQMGIVHHSNYIKYFELARIEWLNKLGISYLKMEETGIILPVVSIGCQYKKSAFFDDILTITTNLIKPPTVRIQFEYKITNQNNQLICIGSTTLAFLNKNNKKPIRCPYYILEVIEQLTTNN